MDFFHDEVGEVGDGGSWYFLAELEPLDPFLTVNYLCLPSIGKDEMNEGFQLDVAFASYGEDLYVLVLIILFPLVDTFLWFL